MKPNKICLGTVNFGINYGPESRKLKSKDIRDLLTLAGNLGVDHVDTARGYGESENILGHNSDLLRSTSLITKLTLKSLGSVDEVMHQLRDSLNRMKTNTIHCVLLHDTFTCLSSLKQIKLFINSMENAVDEGLITTYGYSIYEIDEVSKLKTLGLPIHNLQVPENVMDGRLRNSETLMGLSQEGCVIYVRSLFLQGLLSYRTLQSDLNVSSELRRLINIFNSHCLEFGLEPSIVALKYFHTLPWARYAVIGCDSVEQLKENFRVLDSPSLPHELFDSFPKLPPSLVDPRKWGGS